QRPLMRIKAVVRTTPGIVRGEAPVIGAGDRYPGRHGPSTGVDDGEPESPHRLPIEPALRPHRRDPATGSLHHLKGRISLSIRDVGDPGSVRRPARRGGVTLTVSQLKRITAVGSHQPELMPLTSQIRTVNHPFPVP